MKKIKIILIIVLLTLGYQQEEKKKMYLERNQKLMLKANDLRSKYWGIEYFFEFHWFFSKRDEQQYQKLDLNSFEFQKYLQSQYTMFRLRKSGIFNKVSNICYSILEYQKKDKKHLLQTSHHAAMSVIKTLNNNFIGKNEIDAKEARKEFLEIYGVTEITPMNIFETLVEQDILTEKNDIFSYKNQGIFNYFYLFSSEIMPLFKTSEFEQIRYLTHEDIDAMFFGSEQKVIDFELEIEKFRNFEEYSKLKHLVNDWSDPEQYYDFKNNEIREIFFKLNKKKSIHNDKLFHSLLISTIGLNHYFYSEENLLDNYYYYIENEKANITS